ncbi:ATP-binding cassette domain-containing protein [Saccharospirillum sp. HFRX-1]|uniref:metal ABC transporter ATP-binding protein n=1 Tax=unclassified Saccharospirillum TaxID=2633430 RepID=UPI003724B6C2
MNLVELKQLSVGYDRPLLYIEQAQLKPGDRVALIGANGSGKSTLLNTLTGRIPALGGSLRLPPAKQIGYLPQQSEQDRDFPISVFEWVLSGHWHRRGLFAAFSRSDQMLVQQQLQRFELLSLSHRPLDQLSGGQWQRARLARLLVQQPRWLLLDEPFNNLDELSQTVMMAAIQDASEAGTAVLCVLHDSKLAASGFELHWHIAQGQLDTSASTRAELLHA